MAEEISKYVTAPKTYQDLDGNTRTFINNSLDKKTSVGVIDRKEVTSELEEYRQSLIRRIQMIPPSMCPLKFGYLSNRGEGRTTIEWDTELLSQQTIDTLRPICVILENIYEDYSR